MAYLTVEGALAGAPTEIELKTAPQYEEGKSVAARPAVSGCHRIGHNGNAGPGPDLTEIGERLRRGGDPPDAAQPDVADAVLSRPVREEPGAVRRTRRVPRDAQIAA